MYFNKIEIENYKCFKDKTSLKLEQGINVIVGQNNVGKTSLLEAIELGFEFNPHYSLKTFTSPNRPPANPVKVTVEFTLTKDELFDSLILRKDFEMLNFPYNKQEDIDILDKIFTHQNEDNKREFTEIIKRDAKDFLSNDVFTFRLCRERSEARHPSWRIPNSPYVFPSLDKAVGANGEKEYYIEFRPTLPDTLIFNNLKPVNVGFDKERRDDFIKYLGEPLTQFIYRFRAERIPYEPYQLGINKKLASTALNLPEVLAQLNPSQMNEFNKLVTEIFPNIKQIGVVKDEKNNGQVKVWNDEKATNFDELGFTLDKCGSGVGQVLSILYVLMGKEPKVILIDEPQSFLHPNAARKLIEIIRFYGKHHQIIIATHSPTIITVADPQTVTLVKQKDAESTLENIDILQIESQRAFLAEIGARFSDVFGYDRVIWVEGDTEEICFPKIIGKSQPLLGTAILRVQHTGDFDKKNPKYVENIVSIYERLSFANNGLIPTTIDFIFDKEVRSTDEIKLLEKLGYRIQTRQCVHLTSKRLYENYLLNVNAITAVIDEIDTDRTEKITLEDVTQWFENNKNEDKYYEKGKISEKPELWKNEIHGAKFLSDLFTELIQTEGLNYDKKIHSVKLTEWIIENSFDDLKEISNLIEKLIKN